MTTSKRTNWQLRPILRALELEPTYFDANYNLGAMYFNLAVQGTNEANDMWKPRMSKAESAKQKGLEDAAKEMFTQARPFLEAAHVANAEDIDTIRSLRDIYARTGQDDLDAENERPIEIKPFLISRKSIGDSSESLFLCLLLSLPQSYLT